MIWNYCYVVIAGNIQPVDCVTGDIRLIGGILASEGRLEVCINRVWGTVCGATWSTYNSRVVCRQLGHQELGMLFHYIVQIIIGND